MIKLDELTTEEAISLLSRAPNPLAIMMDMPGALKEAEKMIGSTPAEWKKHKELRGDKATHAFHGNQHTGGKGGGGYSSMKVMGNVVIGPGGPSTAKEYAAALRQSGYKGPLSYPKGKLKELYDTHVTGKTESVNVGHPPTNKVAMSHKGVDYAKGSNSDTANGNQGSIKVSPTGEVQYSNGGSWVPAGPGTTAAFQTAPSGTYHPIGGTIKQGSSVPTASGEKVTAGSKITTSVKTLPHEVDAATSHEVGLRNWKVGYKQQHNDATAGNHGASAINHYSGIGSSSINQSMRAGNPTASAKSMQTYIQHNGHTLDAKITVDRGVGGKHADELRQLKAGTTIEYKNFLSTTFSQVAVPGQHSVASSFSGGHTVMRITVPKGTRAGIGTHGASFKGPGSEKELILSPGKLRVTHISTNVAGMHSYSSTAGTIIHMEYIG